MAIYDDIYARDSVGGRYKFVKRLGGGAFGEVFLAEQHVAGIPGVKFRETAIKLFTAEFVSADNAAKVFAEAMLLEELAQSARSRGESVHLVAIYDIGVLRDYEGYPYVAMERVYSSLASELSQTDMELPLDTALRHMRGICAGLSMAHGHTPAYIHRDLKPDNVLIERNGFLKLADFGLAIDRHAAFEHGGPAGTISYTPPESRGGEIPTPAFDIYSMGIIMLELLTRWNPVAEALDGVGDDRSEVDQVLERAQGRLAELLDPRDGRSFASRFTELRKTPSVLDVLRRCLAIDPSGRYRNAMELDAALAEIEAGRAPAAPRPPAIPEAETGRQRLGRLLAETRTLLSRRTAAEAAALLAQIRDLAPHDERYHFLLSEQLELARDFNGAIRAQKEGERLMAAHADGQRPSAEMMRRLAGLYRAAGKIAAAAELERALTARGAR